jgi:hypothetical protein
MLFCSEVDLVPSLIGEKDALLRFAVFVRDQHGPCARAVGRGAGSSLCARYVRLGLVERLLRLIDAGEMAYEQRRKYENQTPENDRS